MEFCMAESARRSTSLTLDRDMLDEARALGVNISRAAEKGLASELKIARQEKWRVENREAIARSNAYVDKHGVPFANSRKF
jgi:antitoxin CcdA